MFYGAQCGNNSIARFLEYLESGTITQNINKQERKRINLAPTAMGLRFVNKSLVIKLTHINDFVLV